MTIKFAVLSPTFAIAAKIVAGGLIALSMTSGAAFAGDMTEDWSADLSGSLIGLSAKGIDENATYTGTFLVPAPSAQSLSDHGKEHNYVRTEITGYVLDYADFPIPDIINSTGDFGRLSGAVTKSHGFTGSQLLDLMPISDKIVSVTAVGKHVFAVPEPEAYLLVFFGIGVLGLKRRCTGLWQGATQQWRTRAHRRYITPDALAVPSLPEPASAP